MPVRAINAICFWFLALLAFGLFFVAVIWPPYKEYRRHSQVEREMAEAVQRLQEQYDQNDQKLVFLRSGDPLIQLKLQREINNDLIPGRVIVSVPPVDQITVQPPASPSPDNDDDQWRSFTSQLAGLARREELASLENEKVRVWQLMLAGLALSVAVIFFGTPTKRPQPPAR